MTTRATSIPKNFWPHQQCTGKDTVRPLPMGLSSITSLEASQPGPGSVGGSPSAFPGSSENPPEPHQGTVPPDQSP